MERNYMKATTILNPNRGQMAARLLVILVCILTVGCRPQPQSHSAVLVLFDVSGSTIGARTNYFNSFTAIVSQLKPGDLLVADKLTQNSIATATYPIQLKLPTYDAFKDNPDTFKAS